jgi:hypothetical protein
VKPVVNAQENDIPILDEPWLEAYMEGGKVSNPERHDRLDYTLSKDRQDEIGDDSTEDPGPDKGDKQKDQGGVKTMVRASFKRKDQGREWRWIETW